MHIQHSLLPQVTSIGATGTQQAFQLLPSASSREASQHIHMLVLVLVIFHRMSRLSFLSVWAQERSISQAAFILARLSLPFIQGPCICHSGHCHLHIFWKTSLIASTFEASLLEDLLSFCNCYLRDFQRQKGTSLLRGQLLPLGTWWLTIPVWWITLTRHLV